MIINDYRQMLAQVPRVFEMMLQRSGGCTEYRPANAAPITKTVQPERSSSPRRDGLCPWGFESRRNY